MKDAAAKEAKDTTAKAKLAATAKDKAAGKVPALPVVPSHGASTSSAAAAAASAPAPAAVAAGAADEANIAEEDAEVCVSGGCLCTKVQFTVKGHPRQIVHCHCHDCRCSTGAPLTTWASYPRQARPSHRMIFF